MRDISKKRSFEEWNELVREYKGSSQTMKAYCEHKGVKIKTFSKYYYRIRANEVVPSKEKRIASISEKFVKFAIKVEKQVEIYLANGIRISTRTDDIIGLVRSLKDAG